MNARQQKKAKGWATRQKMTEGFIDSASIYEVILALARRKPESSYRMEWDSALMVTAALLDTDHIKLAPSPKPEGAASGAYGILLHGLAQAVSRIELSDAHQAKALSETKRWARDNVSRLRKTLADIVQDTRGSEPGAYQRWIDAHMSHEWPEHARRHAGLFDFEFISQLGRILEVQAEDLERVLNTTKNVSFVENLAKRRPDNDEFKLIRDCYIVSSLLRGRFHDYSAEQGKVQIVSHPIRRSIQKVGPLSARRQVEVSNTERFLANIVMASAFTERNHERRVAVWTRNVATLREVRDQINLEPKDREETALNVAVEAAKRFAIAPGHRIIEKVVDAGIAVGGGALTSFFLTPWDAFVVGLALYGASATRNLGQSAVRPFFSTRRSLRKLAQLEPGRIEDGNYPI